VRIGGGCRIMSHAVIKTGTRMGKNNTVHHGAILGDTPQDIKFGGEESFLIIGDGNIIREYATLHKASGEGCETVIGSECMLMAQTHVAHNCRIGNKVVMANLATAGGFVEVGDRVFFGGVSGAHQFCRIGTMAMVGGGSMIFEDIPPYMTAAGGYRPFICGLNTVGLLRAELPAKSRSELKKAYRIMYKPGCGSMDEMINRLCSELEQVPEVQTLIEFIRNSKRGLCAGRE